MVVLTLIKTLRDTQGYEQGVSDDYVKEFGIDTERVKRFILSTQKEKVERMGCFDSASSERNFLMRLSNELSKRGVTDVLRKGYKCYCPGEWSSTAMLTG